jgi:V/A-type H+-transporting ATPase subunit C
MLTYNPEFVENPEYAYAVARIRALETRLVDQGAFASLIGAPLDRFGSYFAELTGIPVEAAAVGKNVYKPFDLLEARFTKDHELVCSLLLDETARRLISLKYDYELLKLIVKEKRGAALSIPQSFSERSRYPYEELKAMLEQGRMIDLGPGMYETYLWIAEAKELTGREIEHRCDCAYYEELFELVESMHNDFIMNFFLREVDTKNILSSLRVKLLGGNRGQIRARHLPFGTIDLNYLELLLDLTLEGFAGRIVFSPLAPVLLRVNKGQPEPEQAEELERLLDEDLLVYLRESMFVTFGVEPVLAYLWMKEVELKNLRTILVAKQAGISEAEIKRHVRGVYG